MKQNATFVDIIRECNKTAVVGWKSDLIAMQQKLRGVKNVFLGIENIFRKAVGFAVYRWFDPRVLGRIGRVKESGIALEWTTITNNTIPPFPPYPEVMSLKGNVVVQFLLLGMGLCLATSCFIFENRNVLFQVVIYFLRIIRGVLAYIYHNMVLTLMPLRYQFIRISFRRNAKVSLGN